MSDCIFCKIIEGQIPSTKVYENDKVVAFKDINPVTLFHVLIVPKIHIENLNNIDESNADVIAEIHLAAKKIAEENGLVAKGFRLINNCGEGAGQTVMHLHYHMISGKELGTSI